MKTIYQIRNRVNNKVYIGKTSVSVDLRWKRHIAGYGCAPHLYNAIKKYGPENFDVWVLYPNAASEGHLNWLERKFIKQFKSNNSRYGYNLTAGGEGMSNPSEETRRKLREALKGNKNGTGNTGHFGFKHSLEARRKMSESNMGKHTMSEEHRRKLLAVNKGNKYGVGRRFTEEQRRKLSECRKKQIPPMLGKHHSEETRRKISQANTGRKLSESHILKLKQRKYSSETRRKMSEAKKGTRHSKKTRRRMSKSHKGMVFSAEHRRNISISAKNRVSHRIAPVVRTK